MSIDAASTGQGLDVRRAARMIDYWAVVYKRTWRGTAISSFVVPLLYVLAMGVLLGGFIEGDPGRLEGATSYLSFVAPGLLAAQVMTTIFTEATYPVMLMIKWERTIYAMTATPLSIADVVFAHLGFMLFRAATVSSVFLVVMAPFGVLHSVSGTLLAFCVQLLMALAFATPIYALSAALEDESGYALVFRLGMIPMFLFSGAFFPVANLGGTLEVLAKITPLWHGVDLTRMLTLGNVDPGWAVIHVVYLAALALLGWFLAIRLMTRRVVDR